MDRGTRGIKMKDYNFYFKKFYFKSNTEILLTECAYQIYILTKDSSITKEKLVEAFLKMKYLFVKGGKHASRSILLKEISNDKLLHYNYGIEDAVFFAGNHLFRSIDEQHLSRLLSIDRGIIINKGMIISKAVKIWENDKIDVIEYPTGRTALLIIR
jgi:hypothetical protein